jgi:type IV pilus assembly protein PilA
MKEKNKGFTLIELLIVMGIIGLLATIVLVAVNPARQFAQARDTQRISNVNAMLNAVSERIADHRGIFEEGCSAGSIPPILTHISSSGFDIYDCLVPQYISSLPLDPVQGNFASSSDYNSGYQIFRDTGTGRITISAPFTEISSSSIFVTR